MLNTIPNLANDFHKIKISGGISLVLICIVISFLLFPAMIKAASGNGMPIKYISSCEIDLNRDDKPDIALLIETKRGHEVIVLMRNTSGYKAYVLSTGKQDMYLSCHFGKEIRETVTGRGKNMVKTHKTNGTYLLVTYPESSSVAYYWKKNGFIDVWISD